MNPALVPGRDNLPLKKRDQRSCSPVQQQQLCDAANFKAPYPYKNNSEFKTKHSSPFQPVPRRVPALYQPWMQTPTRSKPHVLSAFKEHHGWAEWREFSPLHPGWDFPQQCQHQSLSGTPVLHPAHPHYASRFSAVSLVAEDFHRASGGYGWERTLRDKGLNPERQSYSRHKGPYVRSGDRKTEYFPRVEKSIFPHEYPKLQHDSLHKSIKAAKVPVPGHSFVRVSSDGTRASAKEDTSPVASSKRASSSSSSSSSSASPSRFPWLLPHFVAGSLIELRDGRLRRVEHLQTEDFLLGSLACPDLRLSCCTVQSIFSSASSASSSSSSSSISRLLILLHDQQSQEMVDVYVEYPFFVRGQGWSSCSPQRTARLCGLQCRQLCVGDVCLALTPVSAPQPTLPATLEPKSPPKQSQEAGGEGLEAPHPQAAPSAQNSGEPEPRAGGQKMGAETVRRRHYSAPELRGPGTNCI
ncbi:ataxin-1-like [Mugil cephalus]|uniref:ataxin-1-like n=1 Tax=Mugil cephalus TaxID=48193 RepID=UPI001FB6AFE1|nr:ataxin-1-like [Mugil cephalus]